MESTRLSKKRAATQEVPKANPSDRFQLSRGKKVFKQLKDNKKKITLNSVPFNQVLRDAIRNKSKLHRRWMSSKNVLNVSDAESLRQAYTNARNAIRKRVRMKYWWYSVGK